MIVVEVTAKNRSIYNQLLELDKEFQKATDVERKAIIAMANKLCEEIEIGVI